MVDEIVEVRDRTPCAVVRLVYEMLGFDAKVDWTCVRSSAKTLRLWIFW